MSEQNLRHLCLVIEHINMTYIEHLINWSRLKSALWVFFGGTIAFFLANLATTDILSISKRQLIGIAITAVITQLTKALSNYSDQTPQESN
jgi:hypothetical protein